MARELRNKVEEFIRMLVSAVHVRALYGEHHKITQDTIDGLYSILDGIMNQTEEITVGIIGSEIAFEEEPFYEMSRQVSGFIEHLKKLKAEKLSFKKGITKDEISNLLIILTMKEEALKDGGLAKAFGSYGIKNAVFGHIGPGKKTEEEPGEAEPDARKEFEKTIDFFEKAYKDFQSGNYIDAKAARHLAGNIVRTLLKDKSLLLILTSTKSHDESTFIHDINVAIFTILQADAMGLGQRYLHDIGTAALLHDSGKLSIPADILRKREELTEDEKEKIKRHPVNGAKILLETPGISPLAAIGAFEHHIGYNMEGYPKKAYNKESNLVSMMIAIADYYDALRSRRHYRQEMAPEKTYDEMSRLAGREFHPDLLSNFFVMIGVYPPGTLVELDTREIGIVVKESSLDIKRPQVEILYDEHGQKAGESHIVNLLAKDENGRHKRTIVKSIISSDKIKIPERYL